MRLEERLTELEARVAALEEAVAPSLPASVTLTAEGKLTVSLLADKSLGATFTAEGRMRVWI